MMQEELWLNNSKKVSLKLCMNSRNLLNTLLFTYSYSKIYLNWITFPSKIAISTLLPQNIVINLLLKLFVQYITSARRQKGLTGYCFKYIDRPFYLQTDDKCLPRKFYLFIYLFIYLFFFQTVFIYYILNAVLVSTEFLHFSRLSSENLRWNSAINRWKN